MVTLADMLTLQRWGGTIRVMSESAAVSSFVVGQKGRVVVPVEVREKAGVHEGTELRARVNDEGQIVIDTPESVRRRIRRRAAAGMSLPGSAVDDLLGDRRTDSSLLD